MQILEPKSTDTEDQKHSFQLSINMIKNSKKYRKLSMIENLRCHNFRRNTYARKDMMSTHFSEAAFGSQSDLLIELYNPWEIPKKLEKYQAKKILEYEYDENDCIENARLQQQQGQQADKTGVV